MALDSYPKESQKEQAGFTRLALFIFMLSAVTGISLPRHQALAAAGDHGAGIGFGQILLMGDLAKNFTDNIGFHAIYSFEASELLGLIANLHYSSHTGANPTDSLSLKGFVPNLRINFAYIDKLVVYGFTGFGLYMVDQTIGTQVGSVTTLGFDMGIAVNLTLHKHLQFGTELSFNNIFGKTDPTTVTDTSTGVSIGGNFIGLFLNVTYIF